MPHTLDIRTRIVNDESILSGSPAKLFGSSRTLTWKEIPEWQKDNDYILSGYRRVQNSWAGCAASLFGYLHNQTVNIHSHLIGAVIFLFFVATFKSSYIDTRLATTWVDTTVFAIFLVSAVFCLICSATFHMAICHSKKVYTQCHSFDYAGIVVLTVGSFFPCIYYGFFCELKYQVFYLIMITVTGLGASYIVLNPEYAKPTHRAARTRVFTCLGLSAVFPVSHLILSHGPTRLFDEMGFAWLLASGVFYIGGALLYANRIPEKLYPGKFDYFFASHQIFHVCVVLAALSHYSCILTAFNHWHSGSGLCLSPR